ncbi:hypothetical protein Esti_000323 [Eimeria stiedai]
MMAPRVLLLVLVAMLPAATQQSAAQGHELLQVTSSLQTSELKARVSYWRSFSNSNELHSFSLLHFKGLMDHQQQEEKEDHRGVCNVLSQALERWQQQHTHVLQAQQENQQQEQQQEQQQKQLQLGQIRELVELLEAAAAAQCSATLQPQLQVVSEAELQLLANPQSSCLCKILAYRVQLFSARLGGDAKLFSSPLAEFLFPRRAKKEGRCLRYQ